MAKLTFIDEVKRDIDTTLTVGTFDGVHAGHRVLINTVVNQALKTGGRSVIITFDPHPREIINPGESGIKLLSTLKERCELLADLGIDEMVVIPFDRDFSLLTSEEFVKDIIWEKIGVSNFVIGYDHHFGRDREGTIDTVKRLGVELGFKSQVVSKQEVGDQTVSSTAVRKAIQVDGDMIQAAKFLERYYLLNGTVVHGDKRGKNLGFPTANIHPENTSKIVPKKGVYATWIRVEGSYYQGMMNIGERPTFNDAGYSIEVHILDFNHDIYGKEIQVQFVERIRDEMAFAGINELIKQLHKDKKMAIKVLNLKKPNIAKQTK